MERFGHFLATLLTAIGILLVITAIGYWYLGLEGGVERSFPEAKVNTTSRISTTVTDAVDDIAATVRGVRDVPVPILIYHYIRDEIDTEQDPLGFQLSITPEQFAKQLDALQTAGYTPVTPTEFLQGKIDDSSIILSFDDGYRDFYTNAFPALQRRGMKAIAFITTGFLDDDESRYMTSDMVREIFDGGIEIGAHTITHPNLTSLEAVKLQEELLESRFVLEKLVEDRIISVAYPSGQYNDDVVNMAKFSGYRLGVTTEAGAAQLSQPHLTLPRLSVQPKDTPDELVRRLKEAKAKQIEEE